MAEDRRAHPDCINASNPYHDCVEYCFRKIAEAKALCSVRPESESKDMADDRRAHPDCINASNPYHECVEYCFRKIAEAKALCSVRPESELSKDMAEDRRAHPDCINASNPYHECIEYCFRKISESKALCSVRPESELSKAHPDCINASNPYHECVEYCFRKIAEAKAKAQKDEESEVMQAGSASGNGGRDDQYISCVPDQDKNQHLQGTDSEEESDDHNDQPAEEEEEVDFTQLTGRQKKLFEIRLKMNEARKANQTAMVTEKKKLETPPESRGISKQKWIEERRKKIGKLLDANGLDMKKAYMLDTQEMAEKKYKKWEKDPAPFGWDVFNQKTLYNAYKKRTKNIEVDIDEYNKMKEADPEFYREASSLQYGKAPKCTEDKIEKMVKELKDRDEKRKSFSRRRKFHEEKDIDSINDRNEHFNKKIERAFGKYTLEIKNNLERGTALPD